MLSLHAWHCYICMHVGQDWKCALKAWQIKEKIKKQMKQKMVTNNNNNNNNNSFMVYTKDWRYHVPTAESTLQVIQ